jgi:hypothetical protein
MLQCGIPLLGPDPVSVLRLCTRLSGPAPAHTADSEKLRAECKSVRISDQLVTRRRRRVLKSLIAGAQATCACPQSAWCRGDLAPEFLGSGCIVAKQEAIRRSTVKFEQFSFGKIRINGIEYGYDIVIDQG